MEEGREPRGLPTHDPGKYLPPNWKDNENEVIGLMFKPTNGAADQTSSETNENDDDEVEDSQLLPKRQPKVMLQGQRRSLHPAYVDSHEIPRLLAFSILGRRLAREHVRYRASRVAQPAYYVDAAYPSSNRTAGLFAGPKLGQPPKNLNHYPSHWDKNAVYTLSIDRQDKLNTIHSGLDPAYSAQTVYPDTLIPNPGQPVYPGQVSFYPDGENTYIADMPYVNELNYEYFPATQSVFPGRPAYLSPAVYPYYRIYPAIPIIHPAKPNGYSARHNIYPNELMVYLAPNLYPRKSGSYPEKLLIYPGEPITNPSSWPRRYGPIIYPGPWFYSQQIFPLSPPQGYYYNSPRPPS